MISSKSWKVILAGCLVIMVAIASFVVVSAVTNNSLIAEEANESGFVKVATVDEASRVAGYQVVTPAFLPEGFNLYDISISSAPEVLGNLPKRVMLMWGNEDCSYFGLVQDPACSGINGEEAVIGRAVGEKLLVETGSNQPDILVLYWRNADMSYMLFGSLTDSLNEETLNKIALSIR